MSQSLQSSRPYLIRALHEWMSDNGETPLVVVDASVSGVQVPAEHVKEGRIVLNISWSAASELVMGNESISFSARFGGVAQSVYFPADAVIGIYARESGQGMVFQDEEAADADTSPKDAGLSGADSAEISANTSDDNTQDSGPRRPNGPGLRLVK